MDVVGWLRTGHAVALLAREHVELVEAAREQLVEASPADRAAEQADGAHLVRVRVGVRARIRARARVRVQTLATNGAPLCSPTQP